MAFDLRLLHSLLYEARESPDVYCAIDPSQSREVGQSSLCVAYVARVDRPAISPLLDAFASTAQATGVDLELDAHYRTWLTRIADGQNVPGPTSTIYSRLYEAAPRSPASFVRIGRISGPMLAAEPVEASCNRGADGRARAMIRAEPLPAVVVRPMNLRI